MAPVKMDLFYYERDDCEDLSRYERHGLHLIILVNFLSKLPFSVRGPSKEPRSHTARNSDEETP